MTRLYRVDVTPKAGGHTITRLVRSRSAAGAEQHVSDDIISVRMATADDAYELASTGIEIETAAGCGLPAVQRGSLTCAC